MYLKILFLSGADTLCNYCMQCLAKLKPINCFSTRGIFSKEAAFPGKMLHTIIASTKNDHLFLNALNYLFSFGCQIFDPEVVVIIVVCMR